MTTESTRRDNLGDKVPPDGNIIADRFSSKTLLVSLLLDNIGPSVLNTFNVYPNQCRHGMADSGSNGGSFLNIYSSPEGSLFCGGHKRHVDGNKSVEAEKAMYEAVKTLPPSLKAIIKKRHPKSLGITFGAYWDASTRAWRDLTGQDPNLVNAMTFPEAKKLYAEPTMREAKRLATEMGSPDASEAVLSILRRVPLTAGVAKQILPTFSTKYIAPPFSWARAKEIAVACGYPIDPNEA